jgi:hypothetical protein
MLAMLIQGTRAALGLIRRRRAFSAFAIAVLAIGIAAADDGVYPRAGGADSRPALLDRTALVWMYKLADERDRAPLSIARSRGLPSRRDLRRSPLRRSQT